MNRIDLDDLVRATLSIHWPSFAAAHPHLAEVLDDELLIPHVAKLVADDPAWQNTMKQADATIAALEAAEVVRDRVMCFLHDLLR
jgi:hypothetical protein